MTVSLGGEQSGQRKAAFALGGENRGQVGRLLVWTLGRENQAKGGDVVV